MGRRLHPTESTIRAKFEKMLWWSVAEAAEWSGLSVRTVYAHHRKGMFRVSPGPSPFKVYSPSFREYMETGKASGRQEPKTLF